MNPLFIYSALIAFALISCNKEEEISPTEEEVSTFDETEYPSNDTLDVNQDGIDDFILEYTQIETNDYPSTVSSIRGSLSPLENVHGLYQLYVGHLFLAPNDTIYANDVPPITWSNYEANILHKNWGINTGWSPVWEVNSSQNEYYFAYKLQNGSNDELGWLKLEIDTTTGEVEIVDQASSNSSFIVI